MFELTVERVGVGPAQPVRSERRSPTAARSTHTVLTSANVATKVGFSTYWGDSLDWVGSYNQSSF